MSSFRHKYEKVSLALVFIVSIMLFLVAVTRYYNASPGSVISQNYLEPIEHYAKSLEVTQSQLFEFEDFSLAITELQKALSLVKEDSDIQGVLKTDLALAHMARTMLAPTVDLEEYTTALRIMRDVAVNEKYSSQTRGRAFGKMGDFISAHLGNRFDLVQYVFEGTELETFFKGSDTISLNNGIAALYERAAELYPKNPTYYYGAATRYLKALLSYPQPSLEEKRFFYNNALRNLERGEEVFDDSNQNVFSNVPTKGEELDLWHDQRLYRRRADALGLLYLSSPGLSGVDKKDVEATYEKSIVMLETTLTKLAAREGFILRYFYASWLAEAYSNSAGIKIRELLSPLYGEDKNTLDALVIVLEFLGYEAHTSVHGGHYHSRGIVALDKIDPRWRDFVKKYGWTDAMLDVELPPLPTL
jgi:tetratricopeptide (TPR) repeat protein